MSAALDCLRAARETIADPARWTRGEFARDALGESVLVDDATAVCWCALGVLELHAERTTGYEAERFLRRAGDAEFGRQVTEVNDLLGHSAVLRMYDRAIALADAEAAS